MASSPALSAQSEDDLFDIPGKKPVAFQTQDTIPVQRIIDSPEHDTLTTLPPLPQSQYSQAQNHGGYGRTTPNDYSQYVTQPTQIINRSPDGASVADISSPQRPAVTVQVAASSPLTAPRPKPANQNGVLGKAMGITAPPGTQLGPQFRRPMAPQQHSPAQPQPQSPPRPEPSSQPFHAIDLSDSEEEEQERHRLKRKHFTTSTNRPPVSNSFSGLMGEFGYEPSNPHGVKRSSDTMANSYGNAVKKPRQVIPSRAMPIKQYQPPTRPQPQLDVNDIVDPNMRNKVKRLLHVNTTNTAKEAHDALIENGGNFDKAMDDLLLLSTRKEQQRQSWNPIVLPSSDDELMMTPAKMAPKGVAVSTTTHDPLQASQHIRRPPVKTIAQKYGSTQHQPVNIAPAPPRRLDAFDTPPPQEPKKRTLMRGRRNRSPSPATRAANMKHATVLDDSDVEVDSGVQSGHGDASFDGRVLNFFNSCTALELSDMSGIPKDQAEHFVTSRPYSSLQRVFDVQHPNNKNKSKKANSSFGERTWDKVYEMMKSYEAVDWIVKKCENLSKPLASKMSNWGVDVYGKGKKDAGLDLVNLPSGNPQNSTGKDSGIGTPISDDGKANGVAVVKKGFIAQPASLAQGVQMKDYQVVGLNWLNLLFKQNLSGILADDMGLGKTLQTIAFIAHLKETGESGPHLIVVPSATLENWLKEFQRFAPNLDVQPYYGSIPEREQMRADYEAQRDTLNVLVTTYAIAKAKEDAPWLKRFGFTCTVYDEAHQLKNPTSEVATKLIRIKSDFRLLLTGTPLQNNLNELMGLLKFLMPDLFWEVEEDLAAIFKQSISVTTESASDSRQMLLSKQRIDRARSMLTPFILRRKKWQVLKDLPKKTRHVAVCEKTPEQAEIYNKQLAKAWDVRERKARGERVPADESANILIRLRQAAIHPLLFRYFYSDKTLRRIAKTCPRIEQFRESNPEFIMTELVAYADFETHDLCSKHNLLHPYLLPADNWECSGKVMKMLELLAQFKSEGHRTLIFSQFVMVLDILKIVLTNHEIPFLRLDGATKVDERQDLIDQFNELDSEFQVFMLSTKAGGAGINLTGASRVIVFDSGFNPQDDVQAENRCHRIGQIKDVEIYRLVSKDSVEEQIYEMGKVKLQLDQEVSGADGADTAAEPTPSGIATPAELDEDITGKRGRAKKSDINGGLSKREQEGAALIEDMLFKKLEEDGKTPGKLESSPSQQSNGIGASALQLELKSVGVKKEKDIASFDGSADSPLTELSSSESELDAKPARRMKQDRSSSPEVIDNKPAGRGRRKAAAKASENLKDPFDEPEPGAGSQRTSPRKKGVKRAMEVKEEKKKKNGQATISRNGRLIRGMKR